MTDRERWIIYPLLTLALGASLRDKLVPQNEVEFNHLKARSIAIVDDQDKSLMRMELREERVDADSKATIMRPQILLADGQGRQSSVLRSDSVRSSQVYAPVIQGQLISGQVVQVVDERNKPQVVLSTQKVVPKTTPITNESDEDPKKPQPVTQGSITVLDDQGNSKVILDAVPIRTVRQVKAQENDEAPKQEIVNVSQGRIRVMDAVEQASATIDTKTSVTNLWARQLSIRGPGDKPAVLINAMPTIDDQGQLTGNTVGRLTIFSENVKPLVNITATSDRQHGAIQIQSVDGRPKAALYGSESGGQLIANHSERQLQIGLGHSAAASGLFIQTAGNTPMPLTRLISPDQIKNLPPWPLLQQAPSKPAPAAETSSDQPENDAVADEDADEKAADTEATKEEPANEPPAEETPAADPSAADDDTADQPTDEESAAESETP